MKTLLGLIREAGKAARFRGHKLEPWTHYDRINAGTQCKACGALIRVTTMPEPNGIDIYGEAVALHCEKGVYDRFLLDAWRDYDYKNNDC